MSVIISSTIAFIMGYFLFGFIGERPIQGMEGLGISDMIPPILMFSSYGIVAGLIGILRNKRHFVEVDLHQVFPYLSSAIGYLIAHVITNGFAKLSDVGMVGVSLIFTLFLIGSIKNSILFAHNKAKNKKSNKGSGHA